MKIVLDFLIKIEGIKVPTREQASYILMSNSDWYFLCTIVVLVQIQL